MNQGTILSDRRIRELCELPVGEFQYTDSRVRGKSIQRHVQLYKEHLAPHVDLAKYVLEYATKHGGPQPHLPRIDLYDTESEVYKQHHANFQPMIEPYAPHQVKFIERDATAEETSLIVGMQEKGVGDKQVVINELRKKAPTVESIRYDVLLGFQLLEKIVSYGTSSYGYDVTCGNKFKIFTNVNSAIVDPKNFDEKSFVDVETTAEKPYVIIPPNSFALAVTREYLRIPRNVITVCLGKSTYARCGIIVNVTPFEPEWEGYVTLEFSNTTPLPAKIYADEGCAQVLFFESDEDCEVSYKDRHGKYQNQTGVPVVPKV